MARTWLYTLASVAAISGISLLGAVALAMKRDILQRSLLFLISFAAGGLLGDAFIHLLPEATERSGGFDLQISTLILIGVVAFFILEKVLHWHHSHLPSPETLHPVAVTNLVGDGIHNLLDGAVVAGAFLVSPPLGLSTALAVAFHEIPQELGDFGILVHAGLKPRRALALNLLGGLTSMVGAAVTLVLGSYVVDVAGVIVPLTAGFFIYIASTDLLPELHKEPDLRKSSVQLLGVLAGVGLMALLLVVE